MNEPSYTQDWFTCNIPVWERVLADFKGLDMLDYLEVGCFEGRATRWILENILTGEDPRVIVIDTFKGSMESAAHDVDLAGVGKRFLKNIAPWKDYVQVVEDISIRALPMLMAEHGPIFDIIYVDGDHHADTCLTDMVLSWQLLRWDGVMIVDDYDWTMYEDPSLTPKRGIDGFLSVYEGAYTLLEKDHQVILRKGK